MVITVAITISSIEKQVKNFWNSERKHFKLGYHNDAKEPKDMAHFFFTDELCMHRDELERNSKKQLVDKCVMMEVYVYEFIKEGNKFFKTVK